MTVDCEGEREEIERIARVLREESIKATFFVVGKTAEKYPDLFRNLACDFQIESHTYSHVNLRRLSKSAQKKEIHRGKEAIEAIIGSPTGGFKAPMHCLNRETVEILNEMNFRFDLSSLYFQYDLGKVAKIRPSWFREWCGLYEALHLHPAIPWFFMKGLFHIANPFVLSLHPQYSGQNDAMAAALRNFIRYLKKCHARFLSVNEYLATTSF